jgi:hypothetical protein
MSYIRKILYVAALLVAQTPALAGTNPWSFDPTQVASVSDPRLFVVTPQQFGVSVGTGLDDSAAINAAINAAVSGSAGPNAGQVYLAYPPSGYYNVCASPVIMPSLTLSQAGALTIEGPASGGAAIRVLPSCAPLTATQTISGVGVTSAIITALGSGTGAAGTYTISGSPQTVASEPMLASTGTTYVAYAFTGSISGNTLTVTGGVGPYTVMVNPANNHGYSSNRRTLQNVTLDGWCIAYHDLDDEYSVGFSSINGVYRNVAQSPVISGNMDGGSNVYIGGGYENYFTGSNHAENLNDTGHECYATNSALPYYNFHTNATDGYFTDAAALDAYMANFEESNGGMNHFQGAHGWGYVADPNFGVNLQAKYTYESYGASDFSNSIADNPTVAGWVLHTYTWGGGSIVENAMLEGSNALEDGVLLDSGLTNTIVANNNLNKVSAANAVVQSGTADPSTFVYDNLGASYSTGLPNDLAALTVTGNSYLGGDNGNESLLVSPGATGGDYLNILGGATGTSVSMNVHSTLSNSNLYLGAKGTGAVILKGGSVIAFSAWAPSTSDVNQLKATASLTGVAPSLSATGSDTNVALSLVPKGNLNVQAVGGLQSTGTKFTTTGCSISATTGGATAGKYTSGTTGSCAAVITLNGATGATSANGWSCWANDETTVADIQHETASTTTTVTITGATVTGDVIDFGCMGY